MVVGNPDGIIFSNGAEITCAQAEIILELAPISEEACQVVQDAASVSCGCQGTCNICGDNGLVIGSPEAIISVGDLSFTCADAQAAADEGSISEDVCEVLQDSADCCNCRNPSSKGSKGSKVSNTTVFLFTRK
jgi:hypothetical protein